MTNTIRSAAGVILLLWFTATVRAGVVIQQEGGEAGSDKPKQKVTLYIESGKIRVDGQESGQKKYAMIFDGDKQVMWILSPDEGTYQEMTAAQVQQMGDQMGQMMRQMEAQLAQMPPDQRQMVEGMMRQQMGGGGAAPPAVIVQEKGSGEKVGPYTTTHYQILSNGQLNQEVWAASADQVHLQESDFKAFQGLAKFFEPLRRNAPKGSWTIPDIQQIKGLPVRTIMYEGQKPSYEWSVTNVEQRSIESSQFTLPPNLKKAEPMGMGPGMRPGMGGGRMGN